MKKIWLIFSLMMAGFVYAQSAVISDFEFSGLKRTKESYIEKVLNKYKGLISWSGTAFEYLMPNINIKKYNKSDEKIVQIFTTNFSAYFYYIFWL